MNQVKTEILSRKGKAKPNSLKSLSYIKITGPTCDKCGERIYKLDDPMHSSSCTNSTTFK